MQECTTYVLFKYWPETAASWLINFNLDICHLNVLISTNKLFYCVFNLYTLVVHFCMYVLTYHRCPAAIHCIVLHNIAILFTVLQFEDEKNCVNVSVALNAFQLVLIKFSAAKYATLYNISTNNILMNQLRVYYKRYDFVYKFMKSTLMGLCYRNILANY